MLISSCALSTKYVTGSFCNVFPAFYCQISLSLKSVFTFLLKLSLTYSFCDRGFAIYFKISSFHLYSRSAHHFIIYFENCGNSYKYPFKLYRQRQKTTLRFFGLKICLVCYPLVIFYAPNVSFFFVENILVKNWSVLYLFMFNFRRLVQNCHL